MFARFAKKQMKGVKVRTTISFDVNTVSTETTAYRTMNSPSWLLPVFRSARFARYLKNPTSSRNTEREVILKNSISIFIGFMDDAEVSSVARYSSGILPDAIKMIAPTSDMSQYVPSLNPFTYTYGFISTDKKTNTPTVAQVIKGMIAGVVKGVNTGVS